MSKVSDTRPGPLSRRRYEVLLLLAEGKTNRQIARQLFVVEGTIARQVRYILRRLDVTSRAHAVHRAHQLGLLPVTAASCAQCPVRRALEARERNQPATLTVHQEAS